MSRRPSSSTGRRAPRPRWWAAAVVTALALAGACDGGRPAGGPPGRRGPQEFPVEAAPAEARTVRAELRADGTLDVFEQVEVTARVAGVLESVTAREGRQVAAGEVLALVEPARYALAARGAAAAVRQAQLVVDEAAAVLARREAAIAQRPGLVSEEELAGARSRLAQAEAALEERQVALQRARLDERDARVRAPAAGVVQSRSAATGAWAQPGTVVATLARREPLLLRFDVAEREAGRVARGAAATFTVEGDPAAWEATVVHVAEVAEPTTRMVRVVAEVTSPGRAALRAGGYARVTVLVGDAAPTVVVPERAIRPTERGFVVFVVDAGVARERRVEPGLRTADGLVELRAGIAAGEQVVVRGAEALRDGAKVKAGGAGPGGASSPAAPASSPPSPPASSPPAAPAPPSPSSPAAPPPAPGAAGSPR